MTRQLFSFCAWLAIAAMTTTTHGVASTWGVIRQRWVLSQLSDRQLLDAGIDLSLAGRGRAVAVDSGALRRLGSLSHG